MFNHFKIILNDVSHDFDLWVMNVFSQAHLNEQKSLVSDAFCSMRQ